MPGPWAIAFVVQWLLVLVLIVLVAGILRQLSLLQQGVNTAVPVVSTYRNGQRIDDFELPDANGTRWRISDLVRRREGAVLLFVSFSCPACLILLDQIRELVSREALTLKRTLIVMGVGSTNAAVQLLEAEPALGSSEVVILSDEGATALRQFGITSVPTGLTVDQHARVVDQSLNPHVANWLYIAADAAPPTEDATVARWVPVVQ